jgi:hypothetical protein
MYWDAWMAVRPRGRVGNGEDWRCDGWRASTYADARAIGYTALRAFHCAGGGST